MPYIVGQTPLTIQNDNTPVDLTPKTAIRTLAGQGYIYTPEKALFFHNKADATAYAQDLQKQLGDTSKGFVVFETNEISRDSRERAALQIALSERTKIDGRMKDKISAKVATFDDIEFLNASLAHTAIPAFKESVDISEENIQEVIAQLQKERTAQQLSDIQAQAIARRNEAEATTATPAASTQETAEEAKKVEAAKKAKAAPQSTWSKIAPYAKPALAVAVLALSLHFLSIYPVASFAQATVLTAMSAGLFGLGRFTANKVRALRANTSNAAKKDQGETPAPKAEASTPENQATADSGKSVLNAYENQKTESKSKVSIETTDAPKKQVRFTASAKA